MLVTHIYFNGQCKQAIELYKEALNATVKVVMEDEDSMLVVHAEIVIHDTVLMVNDFGNHDGISKSGGYQLSVQFEDEIALQKAYLKMQEGCTIVEPMQPTEYSPCTIRFIDQFDVRWAFWV